MAVDAGRRHLAAPGVHSAAAADNQDAIRGCGRGAGRWKRGSEESGQWEAWQKKEERARKKEPKTYCPQDSLEVSYLCTDLTQPCLASEIRVVWP